MMSPTPPAWFAACLAAPCESVFVEVEPGLSIHCLRWGRSQKRGLVFVHGGGANAEWFRFVAPFFSEEFDCVAISSSGCGDSSSRPRTYDLDAWSGEVLACCERLGLLEDRPKPYLVAHSLGSFVVTNLLSRLGAAPQFAGVVLCDGAIRSYKSAKAMQDHLMTQQPPPARAGWALNPATTSPLSRFKLRPPQPCDNDYILRFLAESNTRAVVAGEAGGGWEWKGDFNREAKADWSSFPVLTNEHVSQIARAGVAVCWVYGHDSLLCDSKVASFVRRALGGEIGIVGMPCAAHHLWLDQPLAFVGVLHGVFAGWASASSKL